MKIGFDASQITAPQKAGTGNYSYCLAQALAACDSDNSYIFFFRKNPSDQVKETIFARNSDFSYKVLETSFLWTHGALAKETFLGELDLLFMSYPTLPLIRDPSLKTVVTFHDLGFDFLPEYQKFLKKYFLRLFPRIAAKQATRIIAVSSSTKEALVEKYNVSPAKVSVIYEGVDVPRFQKTYSSVEKKATFSKYNVKKPFILFVGTIQPRKNLERLIAAFSRLKQRSDEKLANLSLVLAGKRGWLADEVYLAPQKYKVGSWVNFLGRVPDEDLPLLYQEAECVAFPSLLEGFGLPVLEAMAAGTSVVTSRVSSLPEVGGDAAFYVDPQDVESIASGLYKVLTDVDLREKLIEKGLQRVGDFSWESSAKKLLNVFEKVDKK
ncbi:MAG: glycosyltransferase family 1 protein [Patescibacteria group bacterium]|nr:glycosyltransferase family 1 protein [Patescibacteria group bacterium]